MLEGRHLMESAMISGVQKIYENNAQSVRLIFLTAKAFTYNRKATNIVGMMRQTRSPASQVACKLLSGLMRLGVTPGGGGNAADVGEEAIFTATWDHAVKLGQEHICC